MTDYSDLVQRARNYENDVMWADHAEVPKRLMKALADAIEDLEAWLNEAVTILFLSPKDFDKFVKACEEPAPANEELKKLMRDDGRFLEPAEKQARLVVDDAMVERACETIFGANWGRHIDTTTMRAALEAALAQENG